MNYIYDFRQVLGNYYQEEMHNPCTALCSYVAASTTMFAVVIVVPSLCASPIRNQLTIQDLTCGFGTTLLACASGYGATQITHLISHRFFSS